MKDYDLRAIFQKIELELIASMKRTLGFHKREEQKEGFKWEQWQVAKLRNIQQFRNNNQDVINKYSEPIEKAIEDTLNTNFNKGQGRVTRIVNKIKSMFTSKNKTEKEATFEFPAEHKPKLQADEEASFFGVNENKLKSLIDATKNDLRNGQDAMLRMADDVYRQTIFKAHVFLQSGSATLYQAVDMATKDFLDKGFNCIRYKDGKRVNIASYAEMALRTASQRATFMGEGKKRDEFGIHTVVVSAHANTCSLCLPWQGKILIDDVYSHGSKVDGKYPLVSKAMKDGLFHPNCRHTLITYFPGTTQLPKVPKDDFINTNYAAEQKQRYMERQIRKYKRIQAGELDPGNVQKSSAKVNEWQEKLRQHLKDNPQLRRDYWREQSKINSATGKNIEGLSQLEGTVTKDNIKVNAPTKHLIERAAERGVNRESIEDALKSPLKIGNIRVDKEGRKSKIYIGEKATVAINPGNGNIITTYRTSSQRVRRLKGENKTE